MEKRLGNTTMMVKQIGFGGIPIQRLKPEESDKVIEEAVDKGINFFDTARIYSDSEEKLGRILSKHRKKVFIATKTYSKDGNGVKKDMEKSLQMLKTDYIDLYLCHNIGSEAELKQILSPNGALEAIQKAKKEGKINHIGVSGHKPWIMKQCIKTFEFDVLEIPFNIIENKCLDELVPLAKKRKIGIVAMKPIAGGALTEVSLNLRYILTSGADVAVPGMDSVNQISENLSVLQNLNPLNNKEMSRLKKEKEILGEHFCRRCEYCMPCPEGLPIPFLHLLHAYYFRYNLKDWAWDRINSLPKSYKDCVECYACFDKCPYELKTPEIFKENWEKILKDRESQVLT